MGRKKKEPTPDFTTFQQRLFDLILDSGKTQEQIANETGISKSTISNWIRKGTSLNRIPTGDYLYTLAKYFHVNLEWLIGLSENKHPKAADILAKTGLTDSAINNLLALSVNMKDITSEVIATNGFRDLVFSFFDISSLCKELKYLLEKAQISADRLEYYDAISDSLRELKNRKYEPVEICLEILEEIAQVKDPIQRAEAYIIENSLPAPDTGKISFIEDI